MTRVRRLLLVLAVACFAVAVGIALGAGPLQDGTRNVFARGGDDSGEPSAQLLRREAELNRTLAYDDEALAAFGPAVVAGRLEGRSVVLLSLPSAKQGQVDELAEALQSSGADITTRLTLGKDLLDPSARTLVETLTKGQTKEYRAIKVPKNADVYQRVGLVLSRALVTTERGGAPMDAAAAGVLNGFTTAGLLDGKAPRQRATLALVVAGPAHGDDEFRVAQARITATLATELARSSQGAAVVGPAPSSRPGGAVAAVRADQDAAELVGTIDTIDQRAGRLGAVLVLARAAQGKPGHFGSGEGAEGAVPAG